MGDVVPCKVGLAITQVAVAAMLIFLCTAAVAAYHTLHNAQVFPSWVPCLPLIPIEPFQLTSFALSLLLVFRTNSSYSRWYEGRRRFGRITTTCRDICRQVRLSHQTDSWACRLLWPNMCSLCTVCGVIRTSCFGSASWCTKQ
jgi:predicted membrane chloride channel (bestrophin family)